jgi:hypothetical protein
MPLGFRRATARVRASRARSPGGFGGEPERREQCARRVTTESSHAPSFADNAPRHHADGHRLPQGTAVVIACSSACPIVWPKFRMRLIFALGLVFLDHAA